VQRRRKPKSEPRNIFDKGSSPRSPKPSPSQRQSPSKSPPPVKQAPKPVPPPPKPLPTPPQTPTPTAPQPTQDKTETPEPEAPTEEPIIEQEVAEGEAILEKQLLGTPRRQSRGLQPVTETPEPSVTEPNRTSSKAMEIIEASKARATANWEEQKTTVKRAQSTPEQKVKPRKPSRRIKTSFQPAAREKRLDRSRHMEYKYEVRGLLKELEVDEEHRSALLGTIWAKGERQTCAAARTYILEKQSDGILNQEQTDRLMVVVDDYTVRR